MKMKNANSPGSPLPSSKLPMVACFFRKSLQSFLLRPKASMLWMKVLREDRECEKRAWPGCPFLPPPSSPSPQPLAAGTGMMLSPFRYSAWGQVPARGTTDPLHHKGCPQLVHIWGVSPGCVPLPCSPQLPEGDVLVEAQAVVALLLRHVAPLLPARDEPVWHHCVTTATSAPPVCSLPPWATLLEDRKAPGAPGRTGRHREPLAVVLGVG